MWLIRRYFLDNYSLMIKNAIALIFRIPERGKVKTRLAEEIGQEKALNYYSLMLNETINLSKKIKDTQLIGFYKGDDNLFNFDFPLIRQRGRNLGEIISNAINELKKLGYHKIITIGSDSPDIPEHIFYDAIKSLDEFEYVIGPTEDGGFYLFGCTNYSEELFSGIIWGTSLVFEILLRNIIDLNKSYKILPLWYDIDDKKSLIKWRNLKLPIT